MEPICQQMNPASEVVLQNKNKDLFTFDIFGMLLPSHQTPPDSVDPRHRRRDAPRVIVQIVWWTPGAVLKSHRG